MCSSKNTDTHSNGHVAVTSSDVEGEKKNRKADMKASLTKATNLSRSGSVKNLVHKFSPKNSGQIAPDVSPSQHGQNAAEKAKESEVPALTVTPPSGESKHASNGPNTHSNSGRVSVCVQPAALDRTICGYAACENCMILHA